MPADFRPRLPTSLEQCLDLRSGSCVEMIDLFELDRGHGGIGHRPHQRLPAALDLLRFEPCAGGQVDGRVVIGIDQQPSPVEKAVQPRDAGLPVRSFQFGPHIAVVLPVSCHNLGSQLAHRYCSSYHHVNSFAFRFRFF